MSFGLAKIVKKGLIEGYIGGNLIFDQIRDYRLEIINHIEHKLDTETFISRSKVGHKGAFTSRRNLNIKSLIFSIISFKSSLQRDLDRFYKALYDNQYSIREVTKGALS